MIRRNPKPRFAVALPMILAVFGFSMLASAQESTPDPGEESRQDQQPEKQVVFYPSYGYQRETAWIIPMRIWVHEPPDAFGNLFAQAARRVIRERAGLGALRDAQARRFGQRTADFVADAESRETVIFVFDGDPDAHPYQLTSNGEPIKSDRNGLIEGELSLSATAADALLEAQSSEHGWLTFRAVSENHGGSGRVRLIPPTGESIVSDIDDTIKITDIPAGEATVLRRTFFDEFTAVPCMADAYRRFGQAAAFHYVSGGPWQLFRPLSEFLFAPAVGFPPGSFHMKNLRSNPFESESYSDIWHLIASGSEAVTVDQKFAQITTLLNHFPQRTFTLIGDSGEKDPEIFRQIRDAFPAQVREIRIRTLKQDRKEGTGMPGRFDGMVLIEATGRRASCDE